MEDESGRRRAARSRVLDLLAALQKREAEKIADPIPVEADRCIPVEILEDLLFGEAGAIEPVAQIHALASIDLILQREFQESQRVQRGRLGSTQLGPAGQAPCRRASAASGRI